MVEPYLGLAASPGDVRSYHLNDGLWDDNLADHTHNNVEEKVLAAGRGGPNDILSSRCNSNLCLT